MTDSNDQESMERAILAGGCFWCMEKPFKEMNGVVSVIPGYTGGEVENPTYEQVCAGETGHVEAVEIVFDPAIVSYNAILNVFWRQIDPTDDGGQFVDRGSQYATAIFVLNNSQQKAAEASLKDLDFSGRFSGPIVTRILPAKEFYPAEEYHHEYYNKNPARYRSYRYYSGRETFIEKTWQRDPATKETKKYTKSTDTELRERLTELQYDVTQNNGTERPFDNAYWNNKKPGIYVDVVSGEPLFSSTHKFDSGTGWPSFYQPLEEGNIVQREDRTQFMERVEIRSKTADSHLGHVFEDGPEPTGLRYCMNSAALQFIPLDEMEREGYGEYLSLFDDEIS